MSWTSKWRIPSVRCIASRVIAKTSGRTSSRASWIARSRACGGPSPARGGARGRGGGARPRTAPPGRRPRGSRRGAPRTRPGSPRRRGPRISASSAFACVDQRLEASDLAVVRVDESGKELHGTAKYRGRGPRPPCRAGLSARSRSRSPRRGARRSGARARPRTAPTWSREVGFISGFLRAGSRSPGSWRPQRGDRSWSRQSAVVDRSRLEAALAVGPVQLEAHRSPGGGAQQGGW